MKPFSRDSGIPVLTEVIESPEDPTPHNTVQGSPPVPAAPQATEVSAEALEAEIRAQWTDEDWNRLERKVRERILRKILARMDLLLEQEVRDQLADVLQTAVESLAAEIRVNLHRSIEQMVERVVSQEIARIQSKEK